MRMIGTIVDPARAEVFHDYLLTVGMDSDVEQASDGWAIWVHDDGHLEAASEQLKRFEADPGNERYGKVAKSAGSIRKEQAFKQQRLEKQHVNVRTQGSRRHQAMKPVVLVLMALSLTVAAATQIGEANREAVEVLMFGTYPPGFNQSDWREGAYGELFVSDPNAPFDLHLTIPDVEENDSERWFHRRLKEVYNWSPFDRILEGEVWRLITPIFVHFGFLHILFNMYWLFLLGGMIETKKGTWFFLLFVLVAAIISNTVQTLWSGPTAGGMSGVGYALFGYVWMKGKYQPYEQMGLDRNTVFLFMAWLVLCMTGALGPIGNAAHVSGLLVGVVFGATPYGWYQWRRKRRAG